MKKKVFLLGFIFIIILQIKNIAYGIQETQKVDEITVVNPNYSQVLTEQNIKYMIEEDEGKKEEKNLFSYKNIQLKSSYRGQEFYENKKDAANYIKNKMVNRDKYVTLRYETTNSNFQDIATSIVKLAVSEELAEDSNEGDYLAWSYGGYTVGEGSGYYYTNNKYYWILNYTFTYYTTLEQEKILDQKIQKFVKGINVKKESQYSIIKQINDYVCSNVEYDYEHLPDPSYKLQFTAYAALIKHKAVCQGYATLYYRILKECNINNRIIVSATHSWNLVNIGYLYYNVDTVWNDELGNDKYLLSGSSDFINNNDHIRNVEYTTTTFNKKYPTAKNKFEIKLNQIDDLKVTQNKSNEISLIWKAQDNITGYKVYVYNYDKECWEYYKQIKGAKSNGCKVNGLKEGEICKVRARAYITINNKKVYGKYSESVKTTTAPKLTSIKTLKSNKNKQIKIGWKKVFTTSGYQLQYSTKANFSKNIISIKINDKYDNYRTIKNLKKGQKYYFRIRTYKTYKGKRYYSAWSQVKSIKCK